MLPCFSMMTDISSTDAIIPNTRTSVRRERIEVIPRGEGRRRWSSEEKQAIVAESLGPDVSIAGIARKHWIGTGQLYGWCHRFLTIRSGKTTCFTRVEPESAPCCFAGPVASRSGLIDVALPGGAMVRVDAQVHEHALRKRAAWSAVGIVDCSAQAASR